jgi:hypothetical protein
MSGYSIVPQDTQQDVPEPRWYVYAEVMQPPPPHSRTKCSMPHCDHYATVALRKGKDDSTIQDVCIDCVSAREKQLGYPISRDSCVIL